MIASLDILARRAAAASFVSAFEVLDTSGAARDVVAKRFADVFDSLPGCDGAELSFESLNCFWAGKLNVAALGAGRATFSLEPTERYRELVSTIAGYVEVDIVDVHGWPMLSLVGDTASMTELPGAGNCARQGGVA